VCKTWFLTLREEYKLRVIENRMIKRLFGTKMEEVTGIWRKLHNDELHDVYCSSNIITAFK
jgi:hypothetical protein